MKSLALPLDRAVRTLEEGYVQHPTRIWQEPEFAEVPISKMITEYLTYLRGRAQPTSPGTIEKYGKSLLSFARSLGAAGDRPVLASFDNCSYGGLRDRALFLTYLTTGLRLSEVLGMTIAGLDTSTGDFSVNGNFFLLLTFGNVTVSLMVPPRWSSGRINPL